jgi:hypothetical protein
MVRTHRGIVVIAASLALASIGPRAASHAPGPQAPGRVTLLRTPDAGIQPQMTTDVGGGVHLVYFKGEAAHGDLFYVRLNADGQFSRPIQVNAHSGSALAVGSVRGAQLAIGRGGRVHVAWQGSDKALPRTTAGTTPVLYTRMNDARTGFEPERNVVQVAEGLDGSGVAADPAGNVYVIWHAGGPGVKDEGERRVWVARSHDDGVTFAREAAVSDASTGACGCCGVRALADRGGALYLLYRSATQMIHRDTYLLISRDHGTTVSSQKLQEWTLGACPMSTFALADSARGVLAAWETAGQVQWLRLDPATGRRSDLTAAPGSPGDRKHPVIAGSAGGDTLLAWTEGTGWNKGGAVAWQLFDKDGTPTSDHGRLPGVPTWSLVAVAARPDGGFTIVY